jgi:RNA polymerase sigma-70 factor (ECF subfamily)
MTGEVTMAVADAGAHCVSDRLGVLFDVHHVRLYQLARRMSRDAEAARDLVQDTFLRAARAPGSIPSAPGSEEAWLVRVLINLCRDQWRRKAARQRFDPRDAPAPPAGADPERVLIARSLVWRALDALPPRQRAVIIMYELEGGTIDAIARLLGVTRTTVRWHLSIGRRQLAKLISGTGYRS